MSRVSAPILGGPVWVVSVSVPILGGPVWVVSVSVPILGGLVWVVSVSVMRQDWKDANITATFKKESRRDCGNYRGISLLSIAGKIMARIILNRINRKITPNILPETQCGLEVEEAPWTWSAARSKTRRSNYQSPGDLISFWRVILYRLFSSFSHRLSVVGLRPSFSLSTGCVVPLKGDWAIFCHAGSGWVGRVWSAREKSLEILCHG